MSHLNLQGKCAKKVCVAKPFGLINADIACKKFKVSSCTYVTQTAREQRHLRTVDDIHALGTQFSAVFLHLIPELPNELEFRAK